MRWVEQCGPYGIWTRVSGATIQCPSLTRRRDPRGDARIRTGKVWLTVRYDTVSSHLQKGGWGELNPRFENHNLACFHYTTATINAAFIVFLKVVCFGFVAGIDHKKTVCIFRPRRLPSNSCITRVSVVRLDEMAQDYVERSCLAPGIENYPGVQVIDKGRNYDWGEPIEPFSGGSLVPSKKSQTAGHA